MPNREETELRDQIKELVVQYFKKVHLPQLKPDFIPGESVVHYAGRFFDHEEMLKLTDATLDFWLTSGRFTEQFEKEFAKKLGVKFALLVNSGSSANLVAFSALTSQLLGDRAIKPGDEVITVAACFPTTVNPILQYGAVPVFVDVLLEDGTYNIDFNQLEQARTSRTKAVMIAHTLGNPFALKQVKEFCDKNKLWLVEDNCDALGSTYDGKLTGTFGDIATSSFYPAHHITTGEGGAVYTNNPVLKRAAESFRDWGRDCWCASGKDNTCRKRFDWKLGDLPDGYDHKYIYTHIGYNLKATDLQASIGVAQLGKLDQFSAARRKNFVYLKSAFSDLEKRLILLNATPNSDPSWFGFLLTCRPNSGLNRNKLVQFLEKNKIQTRMLFGGNIVRQPLLSNIKDSGRFRVAAELKNTDYIMQNTLWIGVYPGLTNSMLDYMVDKFKEFVN